MAGSAAGGGAWRCLRKRGRYCILFDIDGGLNLEYELGALYTRVQVQEDSEIKQSYWPSAVNWTQGLFTRVWVQETHPSPKMMWCLSEYSWIQVRS